MKGPPEKSGMLKQKALFYKITEYVVINNTAYDVSRRMRNRDRRAPTLKIYDQKKMPEMTDATTTGGGIGVPPGRIVYNNDDRKKSWLRLIAPAF